MNIKHSDNDNGKIVHAIMHNKIIMESCIDPCYLLSMLLYSNKFSWTTDIIFSIFTDQLLFVKVSGEIFKLSIIDIIMESPNHKN